MHARFPLCPNELWDIQRPIYIICYCMPPPSISIKRSSSQPATTTCIYLPTYLAIYNTPQPPISVSDFQFPAYLIYTHHTTPVLLATQKLQLKYPLPQIRSIPIQLDQYQTYLSNTHNTATMCMRVVERYAVCKCVYFTHGIDQCSAYGRRGHLVQDKVVLVGHTCPSHSNMRFSAGNDDHSLLPFPEHIGSTCSSRSSGGGICSRTEHPSTHFNFPSRR